LCKSRCHAYRRKQKDHGKLDGEEPDKKRHAQPTELGRRDGARFKDGCVPKVRCWIVIKSNGIISLRASASALTKPLQVQQEYYEKQDPGEQHAPQRVPPTTGAADQIVIKHRAR